MDRRCVMNWLIEVYRHPTVAFNTHSDEQQREFAHDALVLLKEQEEMNVDEFVQWCIDSHIMGDATVRGIKYWVGKYKDTKGGR